MDTYTTMTTIKTEPGALDNVPLVDLSRFLSAYGLELVYKPDGLYVRESHQPLDYAEAS